jgi:hypothetical protein
MHEVPVLVKEDFFAVLGFQHSCHPLFLPDAKSNKINSEAHQRNPSAEIESSRRINSDQDLFRGLAGADL